MRGELLSDKGRDNEQLQRCFAKEKLRRGRCLRRELLPDERREMRRDLLEMLRRGEASKKKKAFERITFVREGGR